ncbi:SDR family oxidoreductase [Candidatus Synechococcus calcipolaris G9]|uniref:SDR family oxidoreductase n=1 Tax=Candidatus Synechococcus calcipolaris G9 TaxID=1497997 RepID=A0ABT6EVI4_9SYNE|nr:NAD(P)-binding oxidoreductase [Candidatus Synechococcus calcipolaris]MDG2989773.1 SDR family oxidoreductase [Candidatus Synechococcus calcipolaris G9]
MTTLVVGASGATGRLLVRELCDRGEYVRVIVRSPHRLPEALINHDRLTVICASILELRDDEIAQYVGGCDAVAFCLGHNMTLKGIFGHPRKLVTDATRRVCNAIKANASDKLDQSDRLDKPTKFVLMNTAGNSNRDRQEPISFRQQCVIWLLRVLLPPHLDNEQAADYLRTKIGQNDGAIAWVAVRPDNLINEDQVTPYEVYASPTRSAIFDAGLTSRINVAHFMADLITREEIWNEWRGQMPVIYNAV